MLVDAPNRVNCSLHDLRTIATTIGGAYEASFGRLTPEASEREPTPLKARTNQYRTRFPDDKLEQTLMTLQMVLPTPEDIEKQRAESRLEPQEWQF